MVQTVLISGDNQANATLTGGNDGTLLLQTGAAGAKVNALSLANDGTPLFANARTLGQIVTYSTGAVATGTTLIPEDNTIPQNTEGDQYMSLSITPKNVNSTLEIDVVFHFGNNTSNNRIYVALFQDSIANALAVTNGLVTGINTNSSVCFKHIMTSGTVSSTTFKVRAGAALASTTTFNGFSGAQAMGGAFASRITIKEYLP